MAAGAKKGGLAFLNKKEWHTGGAKMAERIFEVEEKARKEKEKMEERQKTLAEERRLQELKELQLRAGKITAAQAAPRLDWMYQGPAQHQPTDDDYLMGKEKKFDNSNEDVKRLQEKKTAGSLLLVKPNQPVVKTDDLFREDPMVAILKEQQRQREAVLSNPHKMMQVSVIGCSSPILPFRLTV